MSMFPHTVTLYNVSTETDKSTFQDKTVNHITFLRGVLLDASRAVNVRVSGQDGADAATLYVPFAAEAMDAVTGQRKQYLDPAEFWRVEDKSGYWTLTVGQGTWFIKGEILPEEEWPPNKIREYMSSRYVDIYNVTKIDKLDFGSLGHFEIGGN